jgi:hypothetical protein
LRRAQELDPLSSDIGSYLATLMFWARRYRESLDQARKTIEFDPNFLPAHVCSCWVLEMEGRLQEPVKSCT